MLRTLESAKNSAENWRKTHNQRVLDSMIEIWYANTANTKRLFLMENFRSANPASQLKIHIKFFWVFWLTKTTLQLVVRPYHRGLRASNQWTWNEIHIALHVFLLESVERMNTVGIVDDYNLFTIWELIQEPSSFCWYHASLNPWNVVWILKVLVIRLTSVLPGDHNEIFLTRISAIIEVSLS